MRWLPAGDCAVLAFAGLVGLLAVVPVEAQCTSNSQCDDGQYCTLDICNNPGPSGICTNNPRQCDLIDGQYCNGEEICDEARDTCEYACLGGTSCQSGFCACPTPGTCPNGNEGAACDPSVTPVSCDPGTICNESLDACTECTSNAQCTTAPELRCNTATGACVQCLNDSHCTDGAYCTGAETCNTATGFCEDGEDIECSFGQFCSELLDRCVECENDVQCSDGLYCNGVETCVDDLCQSGTAVNCSAMNPATPFCNESLDQCVECLQASHCNDGLSCTSDECVFGECANAPDPAEFCDDGVYCNGAENCNASLTGCVAGTPINCGKTCFRGLNDGAACTSDAQCGKSCSAGVNAGLSCTQDSNCGKACAGGSNDGDTCNTDDECDSRNCTATGLCVTGLCRGGCSEQFDACVECASDVSGSSDCGDGLFCDGSETCNATSHLCQGSPRVVCSQFDTDCTKGTCNETTDVCAATNRLNGEYCDDDDHCTRFDECQSGVCVEDVVSSTDPYRCVKLSLERETTGLIGVGSTIRLKLMARAHGCNVANECPSGNQSISAIGAVLSWDPAKLTLQASAPGDLNPQNPCFSQVDCFQCPAGQHLWSQSRFPNDCATEGINAPCSGTPGNDGDAYYIATSQIGVNCNPPPACVSSTGLHVTTIKFRALVPGTTATVNLLPCAGEHTISQVVSAIPPPAGYLSTDVTESLTGVTFNIVSCLQNSDCVDGSLCTQDLCNNGTCTNPPVTCNDGNPCTIDYCNQSNGQCVFEPILCGEGEVCYLGLCYDPCSTAAQCDDGVACTIDVCDLAPPPPLDGICRHTTDDSVCDTGNFCGAKRCDLANGCVFDHECLSNTGNPCPDNSSCNEANDTCGGCFAPSAAASGSRFLSITPADQGNTPIALLVEGDCADSRSACYAQLYVEKRCIGGPDDGQRCGSNADCDKTCSGGLNNGQPCATSSNCPGGTCVGKCDEGRFNPVPQYLTSAEWGTVYVRDTEIVPSGGYFVHAQCDFGSSVVLSAGDEVTAWRWGDVTGDGTAQALDVARTVDCVKGLFANPVTYYGCNMWNCDVDNIVNAVDIARAVDAVKGAVFPCAVCPG